MYIVYVYTHTRARGGERQRNGESGEKTSHRKGGRLKEKDREDRSGRALGVAKRRNIEIE